MGIMESLRYYKQTLLQFWDIGAEEGKRLQKEHTEKLKRRKDEQ